MEWVERADIPALQTVSDFAELLSVIDDDFLTEFLYVKDGERWNVSLK